MVSPFFVLFAIALMISGSYAIGRIHANRGYRRGFRGGYRDGWNDGKDETLQRMAQAAYRPRRQIDDTQEIGRAIGNRGRHHAQPRAQLPAPDQP